MILVTGATGNVGSEVVRALQERGEPVRALVRDPASAPSGTQPITGDLDDPASMAPALDGVRAVFLLPGYADMDGLVRRIAAAGAERIVLLSGGSAALRDRANAVTAYMARSEAAVRGSGLDWTFLRPHAFMANALRWKDQIAAGTVVQLQFAGIRTASVDPADIGAVAAAALIEDGHAGRSHVLTGPESLLPREQLAILADALDRDLVADELSDEQTREVLQRTNPPEYAEAFWDFYGRRTLDESIVLPTVEQTTGHPPRTFAQWAQAHAAQFGA